MSFLVFLAAMTVIVGQLCFFAYDTFKADEQLKHRLDLIPFRRGPVDRPRHQGRDATAGAGDRLTVTTRLRGDDLEFARRVARLRISQEMAPRGEPAVEAQFGQRVAPAGLHGAEVKARAADRLLQLVSMAVGQKDPGALRLWSE